MDDDQPIHHLTIYAARNECWGDCACGWKYAQGTNKMGVQLAFGEHLLETNCKETLSTE